ncbi:MAG: STAS domain-containing protein [Oligoflexia bacterium]|nr:STAS domain-containing protein [Oligoflexia bacterium]
MQAKIKKTGDITVVELSGKLDFETAEPFRDTCYDVLLNNKVVFNLKDLSFVGSTGIGVFVNTLKEFSQKNPVPPKFCNVKSEFKKIFNSEQSEEVVNPFQVFEDEKTAIKSFD